MGSVHENLPCRKVSAPARGELSLEAGISESVLYVPGQYTCPGSNYLDGKMSEYNCMDDLQSM